MPTTTQRVHNFYAGPAALPLAALERAQAELLNFAGTGMSVMEISHRAKPFIALQAEPGKEFRWTNSYRYYPVP